MRSRDAAPSYDEADFGLRMLEDELRARRPAVSGALVASIAAGLAPQRARPLRRESAFAAALTAGLATALAWAGGVSYAANAITDAARTASHVVVTHVTVVGAELNAGGDQYKPGYGFGDPNHNHTGPPSIANGKPGEKAPPTQVSSSPDRKAILAAGQVTIDEQAALYFSVLDAQGNQLLLTQRGSQIGGSVQGPQVKTIHYVMLVPRTIPVQIRVPANLLKKGQTYRIRIIAVDSQGNKTRSFISFTA
jgi:hypothetical protein